MLEPYDRPELTDDETAKANSLARILIYTPASKQHKLGYVLAIMLENMRLLKEVNEHRAARRFKELPTYDPESNLRFPNR